MSDEKFENICVLVGNMAIFLVLVYLISEKGWNPWWMAWMFVFHFKNRNQLEKEPNDGNDRR